MIYEYALDPELVSTWHDPKVAYPVTCQLGPHLRRVPCAFPGATWEKLVMAAFQAFAPGEDQAQAQRARRNLEVVLAHLRRIGTQRNGVLREGEAWLDAVLREHAEFPFGGVLVQRSTRKHSHLIEVDRMPEHDYATWTPPAPPTLRHARDLAAALAPLLRFASDIRFVDPYFDADDNTFFEPMREYLLAAQGRRDVTGLELQLHLLVGAQECCVQGRTLKAMDVAASKLLACETKLGPLLRPGVALRAMAWGMSKTGFDMHNRYVLTEVGGIAIQHGLDRHRSGLPQRDDLTVMTKEQLAARREEFSAEAVLYRALGSRLVKAPLPQR